MCSFIYISSARVVHFFVTMYQYYCIINQCERVVALVGSLVVVIKETYE
jgi:hypothetical protein